MKVSNRFVGNVYKRDKYKHRDDANIWGHVWGLTQTIKFITCVISSPQN